MGRANLGWQQFESLVGEAFRRDGYAVQQLGGNQPDGGVDLILSRGGHEYLVQCKQWDAWKVGVKVVRELYGVVSAHGAASGFVVTSGVFTEEARRFAQQTRIVLIDGAGLRKWLGTDDLVPAGITASGADAPWRVKSERSLRGSFLRCVASGGLPVVVALVAVFGILAMMSDLTSRNRGVGLSNSPHPVESEARPAATRPDPGAARETRLKELKRVFEAQYVPPKECEKWRSQAHMVECANHRIKARREFLERFEKGAPRVAIQRPPGSQ